MLQAYINSVKAENERYRNALDLLDDYFWIATSGGMWICRGCDWTFPDGDLHNTDKTNPDGNYHCPKAVIERAMAAYVYAT